MSDKPLGIGQRVVSGAIAYSGRQVAVLTLNALTGLALTRILAPADFGIVAIATVVIGFGSLISEGGLGVYLIRKNVEVTNLEISQVIWMQFGLYLLLQAGLTVFLLSNLLSMGGSASLPLIWAAGLSIPFGLLRSASFILLERTLSFGDIAVIEISEQLLFAIIAVFLAMHGFGAWSIVLANIARSFIGWIIARRRASWTLTRIHWNGFNADFLGGVRYAFVYQLPALLETARSAINPLFIGAVLGAVSAGYVDRAILIAGLPLSIVSAVSRKVLFPYFSRIEKERDKIKTVFEKSIYLHSILDKIAYLPLVVFCPELVEIVLGPKWLPVVPLIYVYIFGNLLFSAFGTTCLALLPAIGHPGILAKFSLLQAPLAWILAVLFINSFGLIGYPLVSLCLWGLTVYCFFYVRRILGQFDAVIPIIKTVIAFVAGAVVTRLLTNSIVSETKSILIIFAMSFIGISLYLSVLYVIDRTRVVRTISSFYRNIRATTVD